MKRVVINIWIVVLAALLYACDSQEIDHKYGGPWFVSFEGNEITAMESQKEPVRVPVQLVAPAQKESTTVKFKVSGGSLEPGVDYTVLNATDELTFAPGVHVQYIEVQLIDNMVAVGDREVQLELLSSSAGFSIGQAGEAAKGKTLTLIAKEDDCALDMDLFNGRVTALETTPWWGYADAKPDRDGKFPLTMTPIEELAPGKIKYSVSGLWYCQMEHAGTDSWKPNLSSFEYMDVIMVVDYTNTAKPTMSWDEQLMAVVTWDGDTESEAVTLEAATNQAVELSTCGKRLVFKYTMVEQSSWANNFKVTVDFNK